MEISKDMALHLLDGLAKGHIEASREGGTPTGEWFDVVESLELIAGGGDRHFVYGELYQKFLNSNEKRYKGMSASYWETKDILYRLALNMIRINNAVQCMPLNDRTEEDLKVVRADLMKIANTLDPERATDE